MYIFTPIENKKKNIRENLDYAAIRSRIFLFLVKKERKENYGENEKNEGRKVS